jgi:cell division transport system permease protein
MRLTIREALLAFRRAPLLSALSVLTIAFSLFAFGLFGLVAVNIRHALLSVEERVEIRAFISDGTPIETIAAGMSDIAAFPEVALVEVITADQALERARSEMSEFQDVFEGAFLPASFEVRLRPGFRAPTQVSAVAERIGSYAFVDDVRYGEEWVQKLYDLRTLAAAAGAVLGVAFALIALMIIGSAIRMTVLSRAREISIMRLVGATDGFVRRPFLLDGLLKGLLGGLLALLFTWGAHQLVSSRLIETTFFEPGIATLGIIAGGIIGLLGSAVSVGRHLRRV